MRNDIKNFLNEYAKSTLDGWAWLRLPSSENKDYICLLDWQEGYDLNEKETFIKDGYGLNVSIRIDNGEYFKNDTLYPYDEKTGDCLTGCTLSDADIKDNFDSMADFVVELYNQAIEMEEKF